MHTDLPIGRQHFLEQFPPMIQSQDQFKKQAMIRLFEGRGFAGVETAMSLSFLSPRLLVNILNQGEVPFNWKCLTKEALVSRQNHVPWELSQGLDVRDPGKHMLTSICEDGRFLKVVPCLEKPSKAEQTQVI